ncbi:hypothetical protein FNH05_15295 [Amycolatopsis rhizosphaerae]|uniref:Uncharacterized protein n=1 Tax=Amycolatopsis rhizosphaerae TaxID=2053003 RepID=A0A558CPM8_9PSEU|nr:hypothetical protein [Amycolatopsis rhizosphaerae]TVT50729.1 hypothetical protein FNH05_15295 [Amycolatopsis rhizosphaerae]
MEGLVPGYWVRLTLREPVGEEKRPVGQVEYVDEHGIRLSLLDGVTGEAESWDFYAPWTNVLGAVVATPNHDVRRFVEETIKRELGGPYFADVPSQQDN